MPVKINRQSCLQQYPIFPLRHYDEEKDEEQYYYPKVFKSYILTLPSGSFKGHIKTLARELSGLLAALQGDAFIFLGDTTTPWLYQHNEYKPAREAAQYLSEKKIGKRFNGGLQVSSTELAEFIPHLAWLTRCNASLPYIYFTNKEQNIIGHICQYGSLHIDPLNKHTDKTVTTFIENSTFAYGDNNSCYNRFGKSGAIAGRKIVL